MKKLGHRETHCEKFVQKFSKNKARMKTLAKKNYKLNILGHIITGQAQLPGELSSL